LTLSRIEPLGTALLDAFNRRDLAAWEQQLASDVAISYPGFRHQTGAAAARAYNAPFLVAFSDLQFRVTSTTREGDRIVSTWQAIGTHDGDLVTPNGIIPPTGRRGIVDGVLIVTVADGRIVKEETYWDRLELLSQLGVL
jgi:steroid delta-isomerase-like uncharacterized protein